MSGHSKWANRVHRKTRQDAKRSNLFSKLSREIIVAAKEGGGSPDTNIRLRYAIDAARAESMPNDNIDNAIKRGMGELEGVVYEPVTYECHGPAGVAIMITCLTDNRQRTVAELRNLLRKRDGALGEPGSVAWAFETKGAIIVRRDVTDEDTLFMAAADAGAEDVLTDDPEVFEVRTPPNVFAQVLDAVKEAGIEYQRAELTMIPTSTTPVPDEQAPKLFALLEEIEDHDDVQKVFANFEVSDEVMEKLAAE
ncbi:MAG: YebC/PmpR family DNA-binding transcriptional regulator [Armatimonadia bacterium]